ncbi:MAG: hypothetical protein D8M18_10045, partial [Bacteroidetes bacterium]|nr:hypothetical protein [Bacteroidota bacterium]
MLGIPFILSSKILAVKIISLPLAVPNPKNMMQVQKTARVHLPPPPNYLKISLLCLFMSIFS